MADELAKDRPNSWPRQEELELDVAPLPGNVVLLRNLAEIHDLWGKDAKTVYRAARHGALRAYGRPGRQKYYSEAELVAVFGEPLNGHTPPASRRQHRASDVSGEQLSWPEIGNAAAAA